MVFRYYNLYTLLSLWKTIEKESIEDVLPVSETLEHSFE